MKPLDARKRELLLESDINRQVVQLELEHVRLQLDQLRHGFLESRWKMLAPIAGILLAWRFKKFGGFLKSSLGLLLLRKLWETFIGPRR